MTVIVIIPAMIIICVMILLLRHPPRPVTQSLAPSPHGVTGALSSGDSWRLLWTNVAHIDAWRDALNRAGIIVRLETVDRRHYQVTTRDQGWDAFATTLTTHFNLPPDWQQQVAHTPIPEERVRLWPP